MYIISFLIMMCPRLAETSQICAITDASRQVTCGPSFTATQNENQNYNFVGCVFKKNHLLYRRRLDVFGT